MLRQHARAWLSALCGAFAATASEERGPLAAAITAYAAVADAETAAQYFRIAIQKLIKAGNSCVLGCNQWFISGGTRPEQPVLEVYPCHIVLSSLAPANMGFADLISSRW